MIIANSIIKETSLASPLLASSTLNPQGGKRGKELMAGVILTSLIDAFSILVIYLLMNFSISGEVLLVSKEMQLPSAKAIVEIERTAVVKLDESNQIFVEEKLVKVKDLVSVLIEKRKLLAQSMAKAEPESDKKIASLIIQADKRVPYKKISSIIQASAHAGFEEIRFAALYK